MGKHALIDRYFAGRAFPACNTLRTGEEHLRHIMIATSRWCGAFTLQWLLEHFARYEISATHPDYAHTGNLRLCV